MNLKIINTGNLMLDGGAMFGVVPKSIWSKQYPADENNMTNWAMRCLLVETDDNRRILIDNGIGNKQSEKFFSYYYLNGEDSLATSLQQAGVSFEDITDVVLTHLHFDHCGGSVQMAPNGDLITTFPKATYWVSKPQWDLAMNPNPREKASFLKENILPILESGQLKLIDKDTVLTNDIWLKLYYGHTEGQIIPHISYKDKTIVYTADLILSTAHIPISYLAAYDSKPLLVMEEKQQFLSEAADKDYILFFEHDLYTECCRVHKTEKGIRLKDTFLLQAIL